MGIQCVAAPTATPTAILPRFSHRRLFRRIDGTNSFSAAHSAAAATPSATITSAVAATTVAATTSTATAATATTIVALAYRAPKDLQRRFGA
jgi:hypothetical protein